MKLVVVAGDDERLLSAQSHYFHEISQRFGVRFDPHAGDRQGIDDVAQWHVIAVDCDTVLGCGSLRDLGDGIGEVKRVWVSDVARGKGIATALMDWLESRAANEGFKVIRLDTNGTLKEAQALYAKRGYREIDRYNDNPFAEHFYEKLVTAQGAR